MNHMKKVFPVFHAVKNYNKLNKNLNPMLIKHLSCPFTTSSKNRAKKVSFTIELGGNQIPVTAVEGEVLRDVISNETKKTETEFGICDGTLACSTCHVVFTESDYDKLVCPPSQEEMDVLDVVPNYTDTSRLSCAVNVTTDLEGMVIQVPDVRLDARTLPDIKEI